MGPSRCYTDTMRAGVGVSHHPEVRQAAREAAERALASSGLERPQCLLVAGTARHFDQAQGLCAVLREVVGPARIVGGCGESVLIAGDAIEKRQGLGVLAFEGPVAPFLYKQGDPSSLQAAARAAGPDALCLLLVDPAAPVPALLEVFVREAPQAKVAGGGASEEGGLLWEDGLADAAVVGLFVPGPARVTVAQSHQPVGPRRFVTAVDGRMVRELDGRPAVEALAELASEPGMQDLSANLAHLSLASALAPGEELQEDDFLLLPLLGVDQGTGGLAVGGPIQEGMQVTFALRDGIGARRALQRALGRLPAAAASFGVYFDCASRGAQLYGVEGLDLTLIQKALGPLPVLCLRTSFEVGPAGPGTGMHLYSGVLALGG